MTRILVTGATGTVGHPISERLIAQGHEVRALVRDVARARGLLSDGVEAVAGDVSNAASVRAAIEGCAVVYHAAGLPEQWREDVGDFQRVNVEGTRNMADAALESGVERFVYTSTIDIFAWTPGQPFDEATIDPEPRPTHYERSKQEADRIVVSALEHGLPAVFLHPAGVYGPAPVLAPGANEVLAQLAKREIPMLLPGGFPVVYSEDVAEGHLTAAESAPVGGRYILSEAYYTLADMARAVKRHVPEAKVPPVMPMSVARAVSVVGERIARVTKKPPLIPRGGLYFLESDSRPLSGHAQQELRWRPKSFDEGLERTFAHFRERGWVEGSPASA